ncbi:hypothetical protein Tco_0790855 [Tanacetum coccineum]
MSITALAVARKSLAKMIETSSSSSISKTTKSTGKMNLLIFTNRFSQTPMGFMLAPKSARAFLTAKVPIRHGSVKLPRSPSFWGRLLWITAKHSLLILTKEAAFLSFSLCEISSVKLSTAGRGGAGKGGSCMLIPDLVVMEKVGASGSRALLLLIVESIWEYCSRNSLWCWTSMRPLNVGCIASEMEETFMGGDTLSHRSS